MKPSSYIFVLVTFCCLMVGGNARSVDLELKATVIDSRELVNINGTFYYISLPGTDVNALQATLLCNDVGMKLISIQTEAKQQILADYLQQNGLDSQFYWTSGVMYYEKVFAWLGTGEEFTYTNWAENPPQPDENNIKDVCVYMDPDMKWWDIECSILLSFICEEINHC